MAQVAVPASFYRGGTSRAVIFKEEDLARFTFDQREHVILAALGSPDGDGRQIDGLGGGASSLSKVCVLDWDGTEVRYTFGQVDVKSPRIDWKGACGNMSAAVGPFAIEAGWVPAVEPMTRVPVLSTNTGKRFFNDVMVRDGEVESEGDFSIDGVPGPAARVGLRFLDPSGTLGRGILPTGKLREMIGQYEVSIVDASNPFVFVRAADIGLKGTESSAEIEAMPEVMARYEDIRTEAARRIGLEGQHSVPKIAALTAPVDGSVDIVARAVSMGQLHRTIPATGAVCLAVASSLPGTIAHELARPYSEPGAKSVNRVVKIGHPAGVIEIGVELEETAEGWAALAATSFRSARKIMDGFVYVPSRYLSGESWFKDARPAVREAVTA